MATASYETCSATSTIHESRADPAQPNHEAAIPSADDEAQFRNYCANFNEYPKGLIGDYDRQNAVEVCKQYHKQHSCRLFRQRNPVTFVQIRDFGGHDQGENQQKEHHIESIAELESILRWPCASSTGPPCSADKLVPLSRDPKARFIVLEVNSCQGQSINITRDALFKILAYHQVPAYYLKLLTSFSYQARASDPNIGCFSSKKFFKKHRGLYVEGLGRSGHQFQVSFQMTSFLRDKVKEDTTTWSRYRAAIFHHFDVAEARSVWIITAPLRPLDFRYAAQSGVQLTKNYLWQDKVVRSTNDLERFGDAVSSKDWLLASFDVFMSLGDWSVEEWCFYLADIEQRIMDISGKYVEERDYSVEGEDWQKLNWLLFELSECKLRLEGNKSVLLALRDFYKKDLMSEVRQLSNPRCNWILDCQDEVDKFADKLDLIIQHTNEILQKTNQISTQGYNRENYMQKLLQNQMNDRMKDLSEINRREAYIMRVFQVMALIFLPVTVVSTVFSTDIVKYQNLPDGATLSFSLTALWNWLVAAILLTGGTLAVSQFLISRSTERMGKCTPWTAKKAMSWRQKRDYGGGAEGR